MDGATRCLPYQRVVMVPVMNEAGPRGQLTYRQEVYVPVRIRPDDPAGLYLDVFMDLSS